MFGAAGVFSVCVEGRWLNGTPDDGFEWQHVQWFVVGAIINAFMLATPWKEIIAPWRDESNMAGMDAVQLDIDKVLEDITDQDCIEHAEDMEVDDDSGSKSTVSRDAEGGCGDEVARDEGRCG